MRPSNKQRSRNKPGNNQQRRNQMGNIVNRVFDSAGPDGKVRGTPQQIIEKYQVLARDAQLQGDRVAGESFLQHAEHYARLLGEAQRQQQEVRQNERDERDDREDRDTREESPQRESEPHQHDREARRQQPPEQREPAALATFGDSEGSESGPVETPETASWSRDEAEHAATEALPDGAQAAAGQESEGHPVEKPAAEDAPPKRTRSRRKKPAPQAAEAANE